MTKEGKARWPTNPILCLPCGNFIRLKQYFLQAMSCFSAADYNSPLADSLLKYVREVHKSAGFVSLTPFVVSQIGFASLKNIHRSFLDILSSSSSVFTV